MTEEKKSPPFKADLILPLLLAVIAFAVFANTLGGEFVYDDERQIIRNPLIQESALFGKALTSDVWAFKGDGTLAASNYWRPTFTAWMILNFGLFGLNPFGWHLLNILLHAAVCALAYFLLRRWNISGMTAFAICLIFAVHPVHTESVAWIAGAPDLLFALALLGAFWFAEKSSDKTRGDARGTLDFILSLACFALALGAKEIGILCFPIFYLICRKNKTGGDAGAAASSPNFRAALYAILAVIYFVLRWKVIGRVTIPPEDAVSFGSALLTAPAIFIFYLKQILFPGWLGANYPLRAVGELGLIEFVLPLVVSLAALVALWLLARRSFVPKIGFCLFILPLILTLNASAFVPEQIVHDRYLYLPLLGFLMIVVPYIKSLFEKFAAPKVETALVAFAVAVAVALSIQTFFYNRVWLNDLSLWRQAVVNDPNSAFNWAQLGAVLSDKNSADEAIEAYNNSLDVRPTANAYLGRARNFIAQKKYEESVWDLQTVTEMPAEKINAYTLYQTYEALAVAYLEQKKFDRAAASIQEGRPRLPIYFAALSEKLAVVYYNQGKKDAALKELEQARNQARVELLPESKTVLLRLGMLYAEQKRSDEAKSALQEFLRLTTSAQDKDTTAERRQAVEILRQLNQP